MKSSKKILLIILSLVMVGLITGMMLMRKDALKWLQKNALESKFRPVAVENFESIDFSNHWVADIMQGNQLKVEVAVDDNALVKPSFETIDGTLYFKADTSDTHLPHMEAKVTVPSLLAIKGASGTKILLREFQADSIRLSLEDGSAFTGYNNDFKYIHFETSGKVSLKMIIDE